MRFKTEKLGPSGYRSWSGLIRRMLMAVFVSYRPELHYMRGRGQKWRKSTLARRDDLKKGGAASLRSMGGVAQRVAGSSPFAFAIETRPATAALIFRHPRHCRLSRRLKNSVPVWQ